MRNKKPGPTTITTKICKGCSALKTKYWKDYLDNDETDSGTEATCTVKNKTISVYWNPSNSIPDWCPNKD